MIKKFISKLFDIHPDAMSFKQGMDLTGIPVCTFNQGDKKLNFILDTGSTDNKLYRLSSNSCCCKLTRYIIS